MAPARSECDHGSTAPTTTPNGVPRPPVVRVHAVHGDDLAGPHSQIAGPSPSASWWFTTRLAHPSVTVRGSARGSRLPDRCPRWPAPRRPAVIGQSLRQVQHVVRAVQQRFGIVGQRLVQGHTVDAVRTHVTAHLRDTEARTRKPPTYTTKLQASDRPLAMRSCRGPRPMAGFRCCRAATRWAYLAGGHGMSVTVLKNWRRATRNHRRTQRCGDCRGVGRRLVATPQWCYVVPCPGCGATGSCAGSSHPPRAARQPSRPAPTCPA